LTDRPTSAIICLLSLVKITREAERVPESFAENSQPSHRRNYRLDAPNLQHLRHTNPIVAQAARTGNSLFRTCDPLTVNGKKKRPEQVYRKVKAVGLAVLAGSMKGTEPALAVDI
jgi:hypothetical protein